MINSVTIYFNVPLIKVFQLQQFLGYGGYFLLGALLIQSPAINKIPTIYFFMIYLLGSIMTFFLTWKFSYNANIPVETAYTYFSPNVFLSAVGSFIVFSRINLNDVTNRIFGWISDKCFIIYFVHIWALEVVRYNPNMLKLSVLSPVLAILIITIITFLGSLALAALIRLTVRTKYVFG